MSTKTGKALAVAAAIALVSAWAAGASALDSPEAKTMRCKYKIARALIGLGKKQMRIRSDCAIRQALGAVHPGVNCLGDPVDGTSTGSAHFDARLTEVRQRATAIGISIGNKCDAPFRSPETVSMSQLCDPPVTDRSGWDDILACGYDLMTESSDRLSGLVYRRPGIGGEPIDEAERLCRERLGEVVRAAFRGRVRQRTDCLKRQEKRGQELNCLATVAWPGRVEHVGYPRADRALTALLTDMRNTIEVWCSAGIEAMRFSDNASILDPTAGTPGGERFTSHDLFHVLTDEVLLEETRVVSTMFPSFTHCGDGVIDATRGEECDDGNTISCDGCDRGCTLSACLNGSACGPTEVCDDGNTLMQDGCDTSCQLETCGDGIVQQGLGEGCDDGNTVDCDGCDSNCSVTASCNNGVMCPSNGEQCDEGLGICLSGADVFSLCVSDVDCRGKCSGGSTPCMTNTDCAVDETIECVQSEGCGGRCEGGSEAGQLCATDADCLGRCLPDAGLGQVCTTNADCPTGMKCNTSSTCQHPRHGSACVEDIECGEGAHCEAATGCNVGNSNEIGDTCRDNCQLPACGDGAVDPLMGETCDDGNLLDGDGCDSNCTITECGNGIVTAGEDCDEGRGTCAGGYDDNQPCLLHSECRGFCFDAPEIPCTTETSILACGGATCFPASGCMGGNADSQTCRPNCKTSGCGDGVLDPGEQCDEGPGTCSGGADLGSPCASDASCRGICLTGASAGAPCFSNADCGAGTCGTASCTGGNDDTPDTCRQSCTLPVCGDGVKDGAEACDGADDARGACGCSTGCTCL
jgi:cysteine-rich repeat protein